MIMIKTRMATSRPSSHSSSPTPTEVQAASWSALLEDFAIYLQNQVTLKKPGLATRDAHDKGERVEDPPKEPLKSEVRCSNKATAPFCCCCLRNNIDEI